MTAGEVIALIKAFGGSGGGGGGGSATIVEATYDEATERYDADMTLAELYALCEAGQVLIKTVDVWEEGGESGANYSICPITTAYCGYYTDGETESTQYSFSFFTGTTVYSANNDNSPNNVSFEATV